MLKDTEWTLVTELAERHLLITPSPEERLLDIFPAQFVGALSISTKPSANATALIAPVRRHGFTSLESRLLALLEALANSIAARPISAGSGTC